MQVYLFNIIWLKTLNQQSAENAGCGPLKFSTTFQPVALKCNKDQGVSWLRNWLNTGWRFCAVGWLVVGVSLGTPNTTSSQPTSLRNPREGKNN